MDGRALVKGRTCEKARTFQCGPREDQRVTRALIADPRGAGVVAIIVGALEVHGPTLTCRTGVAQRLRLQPFKQGQVEAGQRFQLIVSNPPYIAADDQHLAQGDVRFEPSSALVAGKDGLGDNRLIIEQAPDYLEAGGWLLLEHGFDQAAAVRELLSARGFSAVESRRDLAGHERISLGRFDNE